VARIQPIARVTFLLLFSFVFCGSAFARRHSVRVPSPPFDVHWTEGGYADRMSVVQGSTITFHIATSVNPFRVQVVNLADMSVVLSDIGPFNSTPQNCSGAYRTGCGWLATTTFAVPRNWPSGYYGAQFPTAFGVRRIVFIVRPALPGSTSSTLIVAATNTWQAYNDFAGNSLFPSNDEDRATHLSFDRPFSKGAGMGRFDGWERLFLNWMTGEHRLYEVVADNDLDDPTLLSHYSVVVFVGSSVYWTSEARANLETYSRSGGHIAIFGGTTMWWHVRYEQNGRLLVGYEDALRDPLYATQSALVTTNWFDDPLYRPENSITGVSFRYGGYANRVPDPNVYELVPLEQRTGFTVTDASTWVTAGTGLTKGQPFGQEISGLEVDGALYNCDINGDLLGPDGSDGTPLNFHIIAVTPASDGHGVIGYYTNSSGGTVFNAATQEWATGLVSDPIVQRITRNVLDRLGTGQPQLYDPVSTPILTQELFNCPQDTPTFLPGWHGTRAGTQLTSSCGYEGPTGVELSGPAAISLRRDFTVANAPRKDANVRFYVNADAFENRSGVPTPIVTLDSYIRDQFTQSALVELWKDEQGTEIRLARRGSGSFTGGTFVRLTAGWHLVEVAWASPGTMSLQIDNGTPLTMDNPFGDQIVTSVVLELARDDAAKNGRVCIDALAVGTSKLGGVPGLR
jgi:hypothetical protein